MEIRSNFYENMEQSDGDNAQPDRDAERPPPPPSPCESDISVGCENETSHERIPSPMDMTTEMTTEDEEPAGTRSPATSREVPSPPSPHSMSPASAQGSETYSYLSDDEYFRPLKRLAMSDCSPPHNQDHHNTSAVFSSPEQSKQLKSPKPNSRHSIKLEKRVRHASCGAGESDETDKSVSEVRGVERIDGEGAIEVDEPDDVAGPGAGRADQKGSGLRSFSILDILSYKPSRRKSSVPVKIVRPWDTRDESTTSENTSSTRQRTEQNTTNNTSTKRASGQNGDKGSALDALFKMTNKTLDNLNKEDKADQVNLFNNRQPTKKKRKSRTAFTNHQIFELEKRFLYQKYLSPADRDELAQSLGLSNAQVITWFQNRRAKLKRDMEELKRDVESSKIINNKAFLEASANVVAFLKSKDLPKIPIPTLPH